jgi:hypothetical protein
MKKFLFLLAALAVCFTSCDQTPEPPKDKINYLESLKVMAAFISDNYTEGDSVIFYNESSNLLDTFVVSHSQTLAVIQPTDTNFTNNEELGYIVYDTLSVESFVIMQNKEYVIDAAFAIAYGEPHAFTRVLKSDEHLDLQEVRTDLDLPLLMSGVSDYTITNSLGQSCYLRKNEGIISFSDEKGNTWTKK